MKKRTFIELLIVITLLALAAAWFWALAPILTGLAYIYPANWTDADLVRHIWHFRLIQPEWLGSSPDYMRWCEAEALARLAVVFLGWIASAAFITRRYLRGCKSTQPNTSLEPTATALADSTTR